MLDSAILRPTIIINGLKSFGHKRSETIMVVKIGRIPVVLCSFIMNSLTLFGIDISDIAAVSFGISSVQIQLALSRSLDALLWIKLGRDVAV